MSQYELDKTYAMVTAIYSWDNAHRPLFDACVAFKYDASVIAKRYEIKGGRANSITFINLLRKYLDNLEQSDIVPEWAVNIALSRYGIVIK